MALASNAKECLHQNLHDARCSKEQIEKCMAFSDKGDQGRMLFILKEHRKELLDTIHADQKALDSLDYLISDRKKGRQQTVKKRILCVFIALAILIVMTGCGSSRGQNTSVDPAAGEAPAAQTTESDRASDLTQGDEAQLSREGTSNTSERNDPAQPSEQAGIEETSTEETSTEEVKAKMLKMMIGNTAVDVDWEDNESVEALKGLCENESLVIQMSMYGGFEQVGPIGSRLPSNDTQTTTSAGDIVLYSSNQIVVFYGSNSWAYTRLGHITDQDGSGMASLLSNGDVTITISMEDAE